MSVDVIKVGKLEIRYLVDGTAQQGLGVFELTVPPGANVPPPSEARLPPTATLMAQVLP